MIFLKLFLTFFKIGAFTFGGGYAMIPLIQEEVERNGWLDSQSLIDFIAVSESTPGPIAVNLSTYVGAKIAGVSGALCATTGVALPSFIVILIVARIYEAFRKSTVVNGCMTGLKPAVVGLIGSALLSLSQTVFFPAGLNTAILGSVSFYLSLLLLFAMTVLAFKKVHPIIIILISAAVGVVIGYFLDI